MFCAKLYVLPFYAVFSHESYGQEMSIVSYLCEEGDDRKFNMSESYIHVARTDSQRMNSHALGMNEPFTW